MCCPLTSRPLPRGERTPLRVFAGKMPIPSPLGGVRLPPIPSPLGGEGQGEGLKQTILIFCLALLSAWGSMAHAGPFTVGLLPGNEQEYRTASRYAAASPDTSITNLRSSAVPVGTSPTCSVLIVSARSVSLPEIEACRAYVAGEGTLVVMGRGGEFEDRDGNGRLSSADKRVWAFAELCGVTTSNGEGWYESVRIWGYAPFFLGWKDLGPHAWPRQRGEAILVFSCTGAPFASGMFFPKGTQHKTHGETYSTYRARRCVGESVYLSVRKIAGRAAIFVAENLLVGPDPPLRGRLLGSLLSPLVLSLASERCPDLPLPRGGDGNLVANGDMERVGATPGVAGTNAVVEVPMGWDMNTWGGGTYRVFAGRDDGGNRYYSGRYEGEEGVAQNSACVLRYHHFLDIPRLGLSYRVQYRLRSSREVRVGLWGKRRDGQPWRCPVTTAPIGTNGWTSHSQTFRMPAAMLGGAEALPVLWLDFSIHGGGWVDLDDVRLTVTAPPPR